VFIIIFAQTPTLLEVAPRGPLSIESDNTYLLVVKPPSIYSASFLLKCFPQGIQSARDQLNLARETGYVTPLRAADNLLQQGGILDL
jgi:hypothetical protein